MIDKFQGNTKWLSNFLESEFEYVGITWKTSEHAYQAAKAERTFEFLAILNCETPGQAKRMGGKVQMIRSFDKYKTAIMYDINYAKFSQNRLLKLALLATGDQELVEGNVWGDTFWGVCDGVGENNLGKILMRIRKELGEMK